MVQRLLQPGEIEALDHNAIPRLLLPQPATLFSARAKRLRQLAAGEVPGIPVEDALRGYLSLMAHVADAQHAAVAALGREGVALPDDASLKLAHDHNMPPLPATGARPAAWRTVFARLVEALAAAGNAPPQLAAAVATLRAMPEAELEGIADAILGNFDEGADPLRAPFVAAALQASWSLMAAQLDAAWAQPLMTGTLCPVCGSHPVASVVRIGGQSQGYRYLHCSVCESEWHMVRVKCSCCEANGKIAYQGLVGQDADPVGENIAAAKEGRTVHKANDPDKVARAETCDDCGTYRKIFNQEHDYDVDPLADDLGSMLLDVLVSEAGYARASGNPLLWLKENA
ncbi:formate dehydrogenase accessory protein FdhE [Massilia forsythiae]|uniref:Formate dehydrogenase accessory protein FdhE n=1 Tax=Massilia forsythiae TaxID=2728020 RepID=A0A7Z2W052_9BURK|nr:formate dehydrogenase accessory protein FdhE [Massilia forsythiae]QJE02343.1 formate dehydrogenase accessory protein FdhE [Massilia forsythiae]